jgi:ATP synthase protein I
MTEDESSQDPKSPQDARLASLDERLRKAQADEAERTSKAGPGPVYQQGVEGNRVLTYLIGCPVGCALIGYAIDRLAGTQRIWVVMLFLGFGVAMWEIWKISNQRPR